MSVENNMETLNNINKLKRLLPSSYTVQEIGFVSATKTNLLCESEEGIDEIKLWQDFEKKCIKEFSKDFCKIKKVIKTNYLVFIVVLYK